MPQTTKTPETHKHFMNKKQGNKILCKVKL